MSEFPNLHHDMLSRPRLKCREGDKIAARLCLHKEDAVSRKVMGPYALSESDVAEDFPVVVGVVTDLEASAGLVLLEGQGFWCLLAGARMIAKGEASCRA